MNFVVFLDVDGVLNTGRTCQRSPGGYGGVDELRVEILAKAIEKYERVELVLTSDWKNLIETDEDYQYLISRLGMYGLKIAGKTIDHWSNRGQGILDYLVAHPEIDDFVILDDHTFDFQEHKMLWERLILTEGIERARLASKTPEVETMIFLEYIQMFS